MLAEKEIYLFTVELAVQIKGRGCVLAPGAPCEADSPIIREGNELRLLTPEGLSIRTQVKAIELLNCGPRKPRNIAAPILLPKNITKEQVSPGTMVYLVV
jgi:hypothetical protein